MTRSRAKKKAQVDWRDSVIDHYRSEAVRAWTFFLAVILEQYHRRHVPQTFDICEIWNEVESELDGNKDSRLLMAVGAKLVAAKEHRLQKLADSKAVFIRNVNRLRAGEAIEDLPLIDPDVSIAKVEHFISDVQSQYSSTDQESAVSAEGSLAEQAVTITSTLPCVSLATIVLPSESTPTDTSTVPPSESTTADTSTVLPSESTTIDTSTVPPSESTTTDTSTVPPSESTTADTSTVLPSDSTTIDTSTVPPSESTTTDTSIVPPSESTTTDTSIVPPSESTTTDTSTVPPCESSTTDASIVPPSESTDTSTVPPSESTSTDTSTALPSESTTTDTSTVPPSESTTTDTSTVPPSESTATDASIVLPRKSETTDISRIPPSKSKTTDTSTVTTRISTDSNTVTSSELTKNQTEPGQCHESVNSTCLPYDGTAGKFPNSFPDDEDVSFRNDTITPDCWEDCCCTSEVDSSEISVNSARSAIVDMEATKDASLATTTTKNNVSPECKELPLTVIIDDTSSVGSGAYATPPCSSRESSVYVSMPSSSSESSVPMNMSSSSTSPECLNKSLKATLGHTNNNNFMYVETMGSYQDSQQLLKVTEKKHLVEPNFSSVNGFSQSAQISSAVSSATEMCYSQYHSGYGGVDVQLIPGSTSVLSHEKQQTATPQNGHCEVDGSFQSRHTTQVPITDDHTRRRFTASNPLACQNISTPATLDQNTAAPLDTVRPVLQNHNSSATAVPTPYAYGPNLQPYASQTSLPLAYQLGYSSMSLPYYAQGYYPMNNYPYSLAPQYQPALNPNMVINPNVNVAYMSASSVKPDFSAWQRCFDQSGAPPQGSTGYDLAFPDTDLSYGDNISNDLRSTRSSSLGSTNSSMTSSLLVGAEAVRAPDTKVDAVNSVDQATGAICKESFQSSAKTPAKEIRSKTERSSAATSAKTPAKEIKSKMERSSAEASAKTPANEIKSKTERSSAEASAKTPAKEIKSKTERSSAATSAKTPANEIKSKTERSSAEASAKTPAKEIKSKMERSSAEASAKTPAKEIKSKTERSSAATSAKTPANEIKSKTERSSAATSEKTPAKEIKSKTERSSAEASAKTPAKEIKSKTERSSAATSAKTPAKEIKSKTEGLSAEAKSKCVVQKPVVFCKNTSLAQDSNLATESEKLKQVKAQWDAPVEFCNVANQHTSPSAQLNFGDLIFGPTTRCQPDQPVGVAGNHPAVSETKKQAPLTSAWLPAPVSPMQLTARPKSSTESPTPAQAKEKPAVTTVPYIPPAMTGAPCDPPAVTSVPYNPPVVTSVSSSPPTKSWSQLFQTPVSHPPSTPAAPPPQREGSVDKTSPPEEWQMASSKKRGKKKKSKAKGKQPTQPECIICCEKLTDSQRYRLICGHEEFHWKCVSEWIERNPTCPVCREEVNLDST